MARPRRACPKGLGRANTVRYESADFSAFANTYLKSAALPKRNCREKPQVAGDKRLDSQFLAAFGSAGVDDGTSAAGLHTSPETVGANTLDFARLIGSFHLLVPVWVGSADFSIKKA